MDLLFCLWLFSFDRVLAWREFKFFVLGLRLKWEVLSTAFCPLDSGRGCPEFWPSIYYLENGNDCIICPACLPRWGKDGGMWESSLNKNNSIHLSCCSFMEDNLLSVPLNRRPRWPGKPRPLGSLGPLLFSGPASQQLAPGQGFSAGGRAVENSEEAGMA